MEKKNPLKEINEFKSKNKKLFKVLKSFLLKVIDEKKLTFDESFIGLDAKELIRHNYILEHAGHNVYKINYELLEVQSILLDIAEELLEKELPSDIEGSLKFNKEFLNKIREPKLNHIWYGRLDKGIRTYIFIKLRFEYNLDFIELLKTIAPQNDRPTEIISLEMYFKDALPHLKYSPKELHEIIRLLKKDKDNGWHGMIGEIIGKIVKIDTKLAEGYYQIVKSNKEYNILQSILPKLYIINRQYYLNESISLLKVAEKNALLVLSFIPYSYSKEITKVFKLISTYKFIDIKIDSILITFYTRLIEKKKTSNSIKSKCFKYLKDKLLSKEDNLKIATLWEVRFIEDNDEELFNLINILNDGVIDQKFNSPISDILYGFSDPKYVFDFLIAYAKNNHMYLQKNVYESVIHKLQNENRIQLDKQLINLLIHDDGKVRFIGKRILAHLTIVSNYVGFEYNILKLSIINQYKLWVSIFQEFLEPKHTIPLILPLLKSKHDFIRDSLYYKLEEQLLDYSISLIEELRFRLNNQIDSEKRILKKLETKYLELKEYWDNKTRIKELNPYYTQSKIQRIFAEEMYEKTSSEIENSSSEDFLRSMFKNTILAKGGGWKQENGSITKLSEFQTSFQLPRRQSISPEKIDLGNGIEVSEDWNKKFKKWESTVLSYKNT